jgi:tetratricopeptide (TPR) repeat protein
LLLALLATGAVFAKALGGEFVYDDLHLALANPALAGPKQLLASLAEPYWGFLENQLSAGVGYWRPLSGVALYLGNALGGGEPAGFHGVSLALHLAATAAAFRLLRGLAQRPWAAGAGAALFALHPVQVESVAWISAVNDPLAGLCVIAGLDAFRRWRDAGSSGAPLGAATWLAVGLLAKESALCLVALALALDLCRSVRAPIARGYAALAVVVAGWWALRAAVFGSPLAGFDLASAHLFVSSERLLGLRAELLGGALRLLVWPAGLNLFREVRPEVPAGDPALVSAWIAIGLYALALLATGLSRKRRLLFALLVPLAALAPALIGFQSVGRFPLSERFLYVAVLSPALAWSLLAARPWPVVPRPAVAAVSLAAIAALGLKSRARIEFWRDELTLYRTAVAASPKSAYVRWGLGRVLLERFQETGDRVVLEEAHDSFLAAQDLSSPQGADADPSVLTTADDQLQSSLGVGWYYLLCAQHDPGECTFEEAELVFAEIARRTADTPFRVARARALIGLGVARSHLGRGAEAELSLAEATQIAPELAEAWLARAELELQRRAWSEAEASYRRALERAPKDAGAHVGLARALAAQDRAAEAAPLLARALDLDPRAAGAHVQLGALAGRAGRYDEALAHFDRALAIDPNDGLAHLNRGKALLQLDRKPDAVEAFQAACRAAPDSFEAHYNLGALLLESGITAEGAGHLRAALRIEPDHELAEQIRAALRAAGEEG